MPGVSNYKDLLDKLGKHKISSGSCIYINSIKLILTSVADMKKMYNVD